MRLIPLVLKAAMWLCIVAIFAVTLTTRFQHPDMSETRLLFTFWPRWVGVFGIGLIAMLLSHVR